MAKICNKCNFSNKDEASFCAECGVKLKTTGGVFLTSDKILFLGSIALFITTIVSSSLYLHYKENQYVVESLKAWEEKQTESITMTTTDINEVKMEELSAILKRTKATFETTQEFKVARNKALNEILKKYSVGTATLEDYDADTGHIITKLSWHKGIEQLMDENPPKIVEGNIKKEIAKSIFSKDKSRFYIVATAVNSKIHIGFINAYVLSSDFNLKTYSLDSDNSLLLSTNSLQIPILKIDAEKNWGDAKQYCEEFDYADKTDWRLPTKDELSSMSKHKGTLKLTESSYVGYWSSSPTTQESNMWAHKFYHNRVTSEHMGSSNYVRCVRD